MKPLLETYINYVVSGEIRNLSESFRGFSFKLLKQKTDLKDIQTYAKEHLPRFGSGSARTVYGLGSGKILKVLNSNSSFLIDQNIAEISAYTDKRSKDFLSKIYDFDDKNYFWIIEDAVKIFADNADLMNKLNPSEILLQEIVEAAKNNIDVPGAIEDGVGKHNRLWKLTSFPNTKKDYIRVEELTPLDLELFKKVHEATEAGFSDVDRYDHWGLTSTGRVILADYGINNSIEKPEYNYWSSSGGFR